MASEFFTILTAAGRAKIAAALAEQKQIVLQTMVVGDGGGQYAEPKESQTKVVREVWRGPLNTLKIAPENPAWVIAEAVLPESVGGWYIREVGLLDKDGVLIAIGKFPETYKPKLPAGASKQIVIRAVMEVTNAAAVTLMVDPSLVMATVDYVDSSIEEHERSHNHPDATLTQKGFTQLNSSTNSTLETQAATPKAVKAAMDKANEALEKAGADKAHKHPWGDITGVPDGTTAQKGVVKLNSATNSTNTTEAATPSAVKAAYDKASAAAPANHSHYQFFTANGTFTVPDGVTQIFVEVVGGGGGGAGGSSANNVCSTGGIAAGCIAGYVDVAPKSQIPVMVGVGGSGGAKGSGSQGIGYNGNAGGQSSFAYLNVPGGDGGVAGCTGGNVIRFLPSDGNGGGRKEEYVTLGLRGSDSILGKGGIPGNVTLERSEIIAGSLPSNANGFGAGGAGGSSSASNRGYLGDWVLNNGSNGSSGIVRIYW